MRCNVGKNRKDHSFDQQYKSIEQLIREADSLSPEQMEKQMEWAEAEAASETPLGGKKIPSPPDNEFEIIRSKMEARGITPRRKKETAAVLFPNSRRGCRLYGGSHRHFQPAPGAGCYGEKELYVRK